jgi:hypothetical protein
MICSEDDLPEQDTAPYLRLPSCDDIWEDKNVRYIFADGMMFWSGRDVLALNPAVPDKDNKSVRSRFASLISDDCAPFKEGLMHKIPEEANTWGHTFRKGHVFVSTGLFVAYLGKLQAFTSINKVIVRAASYLRCQDAYTFSQWWSLRHRVNLSPAALKSASMNAIGITEPPSSTVTSESEGEGVTSGNSLGRVWRSDHGKQAYKRHARDDVRQKRHQANYKPSSQTTDSGISDEGVMDTFLVLCMVPDVFTYYTFMCWQMWHSLLCHRFPRQVSVSLSKSSSSSQ